MASGDDGVGIRGAFGRTGPQATKGNMGGSSEFIDKEVGAKDGSLEVGSDSVFSTTPCSQGAGGTKNKRRAGDSLDGLVNVITKMHAATNARLDYLGSRVGYESLGRRCSRMLVQFLGSHCFKCSMPPRVCSRRWSTWTSS